MADATATAAGVLLGENSHERSVGVWGHFSDNTNLMSSMTFASIASAMNLHAKPSSGSQSRASPSAQTTLHSSRRRTIGDVGVVHVGILESITSEGTGNNSPTRLISVSKALAFVFSNFTTASHASPAVFGCEHRPAIHSRNPFHGCSIKNGLGGDFLEKKEGGDKIKKKVQQTFFSSSPPFPFTQLSIMENIFTTEKGLIRFITDRNNVYYNHPVEYGTGILENEASMSGTGELKREDFKDIPGEKLVAHPKQLS